MGDGWKAAYFSMLRPLLMDCRVHKTPSKIAEVNFLVGVYRDVGKIFFGVWDPVTKLTRYCSIVEYQVHLLLKPNSVEAKMNLGPPQTAEEMYNRLVGLLQIIVDRFTRRKELVIRRVLRQLFITGLKISSTYGIIIVYECAPGELVIHAHDPRIQDFQEVILDENEIAELVDDSELGEREAYLSKQAEKMVPYIVDRLQFRNCTLQVRRMGGGGRLIHQEGMNIMYTPPRGRGGVYHMLGVYNFNGTTKIRVYNPIVSVEFVFNLSLRETLDLFGSLNPGNKPELLYNLKSRLKYKKCLNGLEAVVLNRVMFKTVFKISHRFLTIEIVSPASRESGGIDFRMYATNSSEIWLIKVSDRDIRLLTGKEMSAIWNPKDRLCVYKSLLSRMRIIQSKGGKGVKAGDRSPTLITLNIPGAPEDRPLLCFSSYSRSGKLGKLSDREDMPALEKMTMPIPPSKKFDRDDDVIDPLAKRDRPRRKQEAEEDEEPDQAKHVPQGAISEPHGKKLYRNVISFQDKPYVINIVYITELDQVFISAYDVSVNCAASVVLLMEDLKRVLASRIELMGTLDKTRIEMANYVATNRMSVQSRGPQGRVIGAHSMEGTFSITFDADKIYVGPDKAHHCNLFPKIPNCLIPDYNLEGCTNIGTLILKSSKIVWNVTYQVELYEINQGANYRFLVRSPTSADSMFLQLTCTEVQRIVSKILPFRSEQLYKYLYNSKDDDAKEDPALKSNNPVIRERAIRLRAMKRKEQLKDAVNPKWLLRAEQRRCLSLLLLGMLKFRKMKDNSMVPILDPQSIYPNDPVEVERQRVKNAKLNPVTLRSLVFREAIIFAGGIGIVKLYENLGELFSTTPVISICVYLPKYCIDMAVDVPDYVSPNFLESPKAICRDVQRLRLLTRNMLLITKLNKDTGIEIPSDIRLGIECKAYPIVGNVLPAPGNAVEYYIKLTQRCGSALDFKYEGFEILHEGLLCSGLYVIGRVFLQKNSLLIVAYIINLDKKLSLSLDAQELSSIYNSNCYRDKWFPDDTRVMQNTARALYSWVSITRSNESSDFIIALDSEGYKRSRYVRNDTLLGESEDVAVSSEVKSQAEGNRFVLVRDKEAGIVEADSILREVEEGVYVELELRAKALAEEEERKRKEEEERMRREKEEEERRKKEEEERLLGELAREEEEAKKVAEMIAAAAAEEERKDPVS